MLQYLYERIDGSNVSSRIRLRDDDGLWKTNGMLVKFDQREFVARNHFE